MKALVSVALVVVFSLCVFSQCPGCSDTFEDSFASSTYAMRLVITSDQLEPSKAPTGFPDLVFFKARVAKQYKGCLRRKVVFIAQNADDTCLTLNKRDIIVATSTSIVGTFQRQDILLLDTCDFKQKKEDFDFENQVFLDGTVNCCKRRDGKDEEICRCGNGRRLPRDCAIFPPASTCEDTPTCPVTLLTTAKPLFDSFICIENACGCEPLFEFADNCIPGLPCKKKRNRKQIPCDFACFQALGEHSLRQCTDDSECVFSQVPGTDTCSPKNVHSTAAADDFNAFLSCAGTQMGNMPAGSSSVTTCERAVCNLGGLCIPVQGP